MPSQAATGTLRPEMRIGELARTLGINASAVRFYESVGVLPEPARTPSGYRDYQEEDVGRIRFVKTAQSLGLALDAIREILAFRDRGEPPCGYVRETIAQEAAELEQRIKELRRLRRQLLELSERAAGLPDTGDGCYCHIFERADRDHTT